MFNYRVVHMIKSGQVVAAYLSADELRELMAESNSIEQHKHYHVVYLRLTEPSMAVSKVADICSIAYKTVTQWTWFYNKYGVEKYILSGKGGRRNCHLSEEAEKDLLLKLSEKAVKGVIITALSVKRAAEKVIGHELPKDYAYDIMHRHKWRKIKPHTHHPKKNPEAQEAFKKLPRPVGFRQR